MYLNLPPMIFTTREECDKLTKLIQSRVVDFPSHEVCGNGIEELRSRTTQNDTVPGVLLPFSQKRTLAGRIPYASSKGDAFSPRSSLFEACTPDICNKAVSEAKKWLEEKKLASKPKYDSECGPCTLNTDMLQYVSATSLTQIYPFCFRFCMKNFLTILWYCVNIYKVSNFLMQFSESLTRQETTQKS